MFKRKPYARPPAAPPKPLTKPVREAVISNSATPIEKGVKARPGKRAQTVAEAKWIDSIVRFGCVACFVSGEREPVPAEVHHILRGGRRLGHLYTLPLCLAHHRDGPYARHPWKDRFETKFGTELGLLAMLQKRLGVYDEVKNG